MLMRGCVCLSLRDNLCVHFTLTRCTPDSSTCHRSTTAFALPQVAPLKQSCICLGSGASLSDATGGNARKSPRPRIRPRQQPQLQQQQIRDRSQDMTDVIQELRLRMNETVSGRIDMLNSITTALQKVSAKPIVPKPYRISDRLPRNWEGSIETFHVGPARVDASVVRRRRDNACQR